MLFIRFLATILLIAAPTMAQDPVKVAPQAYMLDFENDWVKVLRVHYAAKATLPEHDHPATAAAFVYLNDSPASFRFKKGNARPSKLSLDAGNTRWIEQAAVIEIENTGDAPAELLRFDLKTKPLGPDQIKAPDHKHD